MQMAMESMEKMRMMKKRTMNDGTCWLASLASRHMSGCGAFIQIIKSKSIQMPVCCLTSRLPKNQRIPPKSLATLATAVQRPCETFQCDRYSL